MKIFLNLQVIIHLLVMNNEIIIEDNNTNLIVENEKAEQIDIESQINALRNRK